MKYITFLIASLVMLPMEYLRSQTRTITIDASQTYQTIEGFGASDCWSGNYVGNYWEESKKETIAKYLFSQNFQKDGSPEGIGLSVWRFNLGAGTAEQGKSSDIEDIARRAECFLDDMWTGYDWTKQAGQQWFLRKAKAYGCDNFTAFSNSPLVCYTRNGKGYGKNDGNSNLQADKYDDFAEYLATIMKHFEDENISFKYISPVNEPQHNWDKPDQEGSPWQNEEIKKLVIELNKSLQQRNLTTKILLSDAASWNDLYRTEARASNQIRAFFDESSATYIGDLPSLARAVGGHSYWTHKNNTELKDTRYNIRVVANNYNLDVHQTEWSLLSETSDIPNIESASYMDIALFMAKVIHSDLSLANVTSWSYWTSMEAERYSHKNRFLLIALEPGGDFYKPVTQSGNLYDRPTLWALGNYSFFVRPGYKRMKMQGAEDLFGLMGSAYIAPDSSQVVAVYVNTLNEPVKIQNKLQNIVGKTPVSNKMYITANTYSLKKYGSASADIYNPDKEFSIPARAVVTIVYDMEKENTSMKNPMVNQRQLTVYPNPVSVSGKLHIEFPEEINNEATLSIYSLQGQLLFIEKGRIFGAQTSVSIPDSLVQGSYFLKIQSRERLYQGRFETTHQNKL